MKSMAKLRALVTIVTAMVMMIAFAPFSIRTLQAEETGPSFPLNLLIGLEETEGADIEREFRLGKEEKAAYGTVYRFEQIKDDFVVPDGEVIVSVDKDGNILSVFGEYQKVAAPKVLLSLEEAEAIISGEPISDRKIIYDGEAAYEIVTDHNGGYKFVVSALSGKLLYSEPHTGSVQEERTTPSGDKYIVEHQLGKYYLMDSVRNITVFDAHSATNPNTATQYENSTGEFEELAVKSLADMSKAYDFYADANNIGVSRKGITDNNDDVPYNHAERNESVLFIFMHYGYQYENAACVYTHGTGQAYMLIGDGNEHGTSIYLPARATDVIAHEYQHAISMEICDLGTVNDAGAINESMSDIFGALIEGYDLDDEAGRFWRIGEDAVPSTRTDLRDIRGGSRNCAYNMRERYPRCNIPYNVDVSPWDPAYHDHTTCDHGGVHYNSTIVTHAQYLMYEKLPDFFTRERIGTLWYNTLLLLGNDTTFEEFAGKMLTTAKNLGYNEEQLSAVHYGFEQIGLEQKYKVTFVDYDGTVLKEQTVPYGGKAEFPEDPFRAPDSEHAYEFSGWSIDPSNVTEDLTVTAQYEEKERYYSVKFVDNDGNEIKVSSIDYGASLELPSAESMTDKMGENYEFEGWYVDEARTELAEDIVVKSAMTIYGKWVLKPVSERLFSIKYLNGDGAEIRSVTAKYGDTLDLSPPEQEIDGFEFEGWYLDEALQQKANSATVEADMTLYGKWVEKAKGCASCGTVYTGSGDPTLPSALCLAAIAATAIVLVPKRKRSK